jgi:hypothetical protein
VAATFKPISMSLTTVLATGYTVPAGKVALVFGIHIANIDGVNDVDVTMQWLDSANANAATQLAKVITVPAGSALALLAKAIPLKAGDAIQGVASANGDAQATLSVVEIS